MKKSGRYDTSSLIEDQYESGSRGRVLKNLLGIKSKREMSRIETHELLNATKALIETIDQDHRFTKEDISICIACGWVLYMNGQVNTDR